MKLFLAVLQKELTVEWRSKEVILTSAFFAFLLAVVFMFGFFEGERIFGDAENEYLKLGPGILWIGMMFSATIIFTRSFEREREAGCMQALRLVPGIHVPLFWGKCAANMVMLAGVALILVPSVAVFFSIPMGRFAVPLAGLLFLGMTGLVTVGTLLSAALVNTRLRGVLMPLVLFPLVIPLLVGAVSATESLVRGQPGELWDWTRLMIAFDAIYIVVSNWLFRTVVEAEE